MLALSWPPSKICLIQWNDSRVEGKGGNSGVGGVGGVGSDGGGRGGGDVTVASANVCTMMHAARVDTGSRWQQQRRRRPPANPHFSRALTSPAQ